MLLLSYHYRKLINYFKTLNGYIKLDTSKIIFYKDNHLILVL